MVVLMSGFWFDVLGFVVVFAVVFGLVVGCEHKRSWERERRNISM
jgi:hypothetical protein